MTVENRKNRRLLILGGVLFALVAAFASIVSYRDHLQNQKNQETFRGHLNRLEKDRGNTWKFHAHNERVAHHLPTSAHQDRKIPTERK